MFLAMLKELELGLHEIFRVEGRNLFYEVELELIPLGLQMMLKEVAEAIITAVLNTKYFKEAGDYIGSLLAACDPRATKVKVSLETSSRRGVYEIFYSCRSHMDSDLRLSVLIAKDALGEYLKLGNLVWRA
jgi:hypothetical protein